MNIDNKGLTKEEIDIIRTFVHSSDNTMSDAMTIAEIRSAAEMMDRFKYQEVKHYVKNWRKGVYLVKEGMGIGIH